MKIKQFGRGKGARLAVLFLVISLLAAWNPCFAGQASDLGKEIKEKAKKMKLDKANVVYGKKNGKNVKFTWAKLEHVKSKKDLEKGEVIGVIENELEGGETNLPPGKHNLYLKKVNGEWKIYAESGGVVVAEAERVKVEDSQKGKPIGKSRIEFGSICFFLCGCVWGWCGCIWGCV